jgi:hypothetical protein
VREGTAPAAFSDESKMGGFSRFGSPTISLSESGSTGVQAKIAGDMPIHPSWDIDATLRINWKEKPNGGGVCFDGDVVGDGFPDAEVFVLGSGKTTMIHKSPTSFGPALGPTVILAGEHTRPMGSFNKCD